ncbi:MAG: type VI secretion system baseplate subunit TssE [Candidatus Accumulibacter sp.]|jgi:type VI secretion system protein ImpF|nr:type VI secretion system baseplate subunit TssE [Accumulibacter sp.]
MQRTHPLAQENEVKAAPTPLRPYVHLRPTLFDRLCDDNPRRRTELAREISISAKELLQIIQRDLSYLLNTINAGDLFKDGSFPEASASTLNYGIDPLAGGYLLEKKRRHIEQAIHQAILIFEPRLIPESLSVVSLFGNDSSRHYNILRFEIRGLVRADPYPLEFLVQSSVDMETNHFTLSIA